MVSSQNKFFETYNKYEKLQNRKNKSFEVLNNIKEDFDKQSVFKKNNISVFAAGSLGRSEYGNKSDLDIFIISHEDTSIKKLDEIEIFHQLICINKRQKFDDFSNDGQF